MLRRGSTALFIKKGSDFLLGGGGGGAGLQRFQKKTIILRWI
jgi:hypothetical protein